MPGKSLTLVGTGIKFLSHLTTEARAHICNTPRVLYLVNEPGMKQWIAKHAHFSQSLDFLYNKFHLRYDAYNAITEYILKELNEFNHICVVFYGHPSFFAEAGLNAIIKARNIGVQVKVLPGIASDACLFADLLIDPSSSGYQSFEATDFLIYKRQIDPSCHLLLWQVDVLGRLDNPQEFENSHALKILVEYLGRSYPLLHEIVLYEAAQYPSLEPTINKIFLKDLPLTKISAITTVYIPPGQKKNCDQDLLKKLKLNG